MNLYLLRHGDAIEHGYADADRPLSPLGEKQAKAAAGKLRELNLIPDCILSSPLKRARQMALIVQEELKVKDTMITEHLVPSSDHRQIIDQINNLSTPSVLLVGHEPHMSMLISLLISGSRSVPVQFKKGSLACLDIEIPIKAGDGVLCWLLTTEQMQLRQ